MSEEHERYMAVREGACNAASDDYFTPRSSIDEPKFHRIFDAGFKAAYDTREAELSALREQLSQLQREKDGLPALIAAAKQEMRERCANIASTAKEHYDKHDIAAAIREFKD